MSQELSDRDLDALVAEKVMGLVVKPIRVIGRTVTKDIGTVSEPYTMGDGREGVEAKAIPRYSTDISAAMEVVAHMEAQNYQWAFHRTAPVKSMHDNKPHAEFWKYREGVLQGVHSGTADTLPRAICLAALKAINGDAVKE